MFLNSSKILNQIYIKNQNKFQIFVNLFIILELIYINN